MVEAAPQLDFVQVYRKSLSDKTVLGLKLTYSMIGNIETSGGYSLHPFHERDPDFPNYNTFTGARYWTLAFTVKHLFGN